MGCDIAKVFGLCEHCGFNPRTRMGCDPLGNGNSQKFQGFQSPHPHGVRRIEKFNFPGRYMFQSPHPHGVRHRFTLCFSSPFLVSIPAPAWGATWTFDDAMKWGRFNPRTRMGCDKKQKSVPYAVKQFQSPHPHGVRLLKR